MAINFPASAVDGEEYTYLITQQVFTCSRSSPTAVAKWAAKGTINPTSFGYRGVLSITGAPISERVTSGPFRTVVCLFFTGLAVHK